MVKHVTVHLTNNCNLSCKACHVAASSTKGSDIDINPDILRHLFLSPLESISIAGGEPFSVKARLYRFLDAIPKTTKRLAITTNGTLLQQDDFEILKAKDVSLQISLDGMQSTHDENRGQGSFLLTTNCIKTAIKANLRVDILTIVSNENMSQLDEFIRYVDSLGVSNITLLHFTPKGRGEQHQNLEVQREKWLRFCYGKNLAIKGLNARLWIQPRFLTLQQAASISQLRNVFICNVYRWEYAYIDVSTGFVYPCGLSYNTDMIAGNLKNEPLCSITENAKHAFSIPNGCSSCDKSSICMGGARCYSWLLSGHSDGGDPYCMNDDIIPVCPFPAVQIAGPKVNALQPTII